MCSNKKKKKKKKTKGTMMMTMTTMRRPLDAPSSFFARSSMMTRRHLHHRHHNHHHHQRAAAKTKTTTSAGFLFGKPKDAGETATKESLQYELEKRRVREELGEELRRTKKERDDAIKQSCIKDGERREKDVFKLEKLTQEQEQKFNAFEIVVKKQIKLLEGMVKERDEQLAETQQK